MGKALGLNFGNFAAKFRLGSGNFGLRQAPGKGKKPGLPIALILSLGRLEAAPGVQGFKGSGSGGSTSISKRPNPRLRVASERGSKALGKWGVSKRPNPRLRAAPY